MPATKAKSATPKAHAKVAVAVTSTKPKPPCRLKPRKPDPLTKNMLQILKAIQGDRLPAANGATTPEEGAQQGALAYTLKQLARRGLIELRENGKPKLLPAGRTAIKAVYGG